MSSAPADQHPLHSSLPATLSTLSYSPNPSQYIHVLTSLLHPSECTSIIAAHTNLIPSHVTPQTVRSREIFKDPALAEELWERMRGLYGEGKEGERVVDEDGEVWRISGLNEVFRLCFYEAGGKFSPHTDGRRLASLNSQSFMTLNIYLNTLPATSGGATRFLLPPSHSPSTLTTNKTSTTKLATQAQALPLPTHQPTLGSALLFPHDLWHDGAEVFSGQKWLLRTDVMYTRERKFDWGVFCTERGWIGAGEMEREQKGRKALAFAEGLEDAGDMEEAIRWYKVAFREWPALERG